MGGGSVVDLGDALVEDVLVVFDAGLQQVEVLVRVLL